VSNAPPSSGADRAGFVIAAVLVLVGVAIAVSTMRAGGVMGYSPVGPKTVPYILAAAFLVLGVLTGVAALRRDFPEREEQDWPPMLWVIGGLAVQLLAMKSLGFSVATGLLFAATAKGFGRGPLLVTVPVGIVFSFVVWLIFARGLQLSLPAGPLERLF
jgi:putative tricarboxylic transport membrane protein